MPTLSKRQVQARSAIAERWPMSNIQYESERSDENDYKIDADFDVRVDGEEDTLDKFHLNDIGDLLQLCVQQGNLKNISVLLYMTLRYFHVTWRDINDFLQEIGATRCTTAEKWTQIYLTGDLIEFNSDNRGGKLKESFYDLFPDIESEAKLFAMRECQKKTSEFTAADLRDFIDAKFYEVTGLKKDNNNSFIRSERTCRLDLKRWGAKFEKNSQRPYFEGMILKSRENIEKRTKRR
jgi:hypothetical protein